MIPAVCSICADYFESEHTVVASPCGHVFHEHCLLQWIVNSSTCPQCRRHTTSRSLIRLFFEVQEEEDGQLDPTRLKNQLGELEAEIAKTKKEKADLSQEISHYNGRVDTLTRNVKKLTKKLTDEQSTNDALKKQLSVMSYRMDEAKEAKREAKKLREKLQFLERFEVVMNKNTDMVDDMLREFGEGAKAARELATYCASLKREFENIKEARKQLKEENGKLRKDLNHKSRAFEERRRHAEALQQSVTSLQEEVQCLERGRKDLEETIEALEGAIRSGRAKDLDSSKSFTPSDLRKKPRLSLPEEGDLIILQPGDPSTPDPSMPSPSLETKHACQELGIPFVKTTSLANRKKKVESTPAEIAAWRSTMASSSLFNQRRAQQGQGQGQGQGQKRPAGGMGKGYDGMGGHETFIQHPPIRVSQKKIVRGVKRKPSGKPCTQPLPTLDRFMTSS